MLSPDDDIEVVLVVGVSHQGLERFQLGRIYRPAPLKLVFALKWSFGFSFGDWFEFLDFYLCGHRDKFWPLFDPISEGDGVIL